MTFQQAAAVIDSILAHEARARWFLPNTREIAIESLLNQATNEARVDAVSAILKERSVSWLYDDPCDAWAA